MKQAKDFLKEASGIIVTKTLIGAPRVDLDLFLQNVSSLLHFNVPIDEIEQRFNSHSLTLDTDNIDFSAAEGIQDIAITEIHSGDQIENYLLTLSWEKLLTPVQATAIGGTSSKVLNYRVTASLVEAGIEEENSDDFEDEIDPVINEEVNLDEARTGISVKAALGILYDAGIKVEDGAKLLKKLKQATSGYYYADDVNKLAKKNIKEETNLDEAKVTMNDFVNVKLKNLPAGIQKKAQIEFDSIKDKGLKSVLLQKGSELMQSPVDKLEVAKGRGFEIIITEGTSEDEIKAKLKDITKGEFIDGYSVDGATVNISVEDNTSSENATKVKEQISKMLDDADIKVIVGK